MGFLQERKDREEFEEAPWPTVEQDDWHCLWVLGEEADKV